MTCFDQLVLMTFNNEWLHVLTFLCSFEFMFLIKAAIFLSVHVTIEC